jgi:deoxyribodipyrimidine photolyase-related protein
MRDACFLAELARFEPDPDGRTWHVVLADQLSADIGPPASIPPERLGLIVVEDRGALRRRPYHRQRIALILANLRHFCLEQARRGVAVRRVVIEGDLEHALVRAFRAVGGATLMRPAQWEDRQEFAPLVEAGMVREVAHDGWLSTRDDFDGSMRSLKRWKMDSFYRHMRRRTGILMEDGQPEGGAFSFDAENRKPWRGDPPPPAPPHFEADAITREVCDEVEREFSEHPGQVDVGALPASAEDAESLWAWALEECLPSFGPFEDAMTTASPGLFHTRISSLVNLHRLLPERVVRDVAASSAPIASREGFVRQVLGWREYVRHVHDATDGFRTLDGVPTPVDPSPGDGGWSRWSGEDWENQEASRPRGGARPNHLEADLPLPMAYWGRPSGLECLDRVVADVWREGWSHHITRLMVLGNIATLIGADPRELTDWFWAAYTDAWDWVVEPNVLGMATFATGELMTTKPYVSGAAYIHRMSDYCSECAFDPKTNCPLTSLYWSFLDQHGERLARNPRMRVVLNALAKRPSERRAADREVAADVRRTLSEGRPLSPATRG